MQGLLEGQWKKPKCATNPSKAHLHECPMGGGQMRGGTRAPQWIDAQWREPLPILLQKLDGEGRKRTGSGVPPVWALGLEVPTFGGLEGVPEVPPLGSGKGGNWSPPSPSGWRVVMGWGGPEVG
ncbi:hypothetical protein Taro_010695 [Colocasia esculenta]|uniref:Uncharacterized protein n=1 Tax=Colocasia esculenta TaxID=4460 RepID=A0A843UAC7_COLES|nr:hypothetical protein [Colocasia esculenta]